MGLTQRVEDLPERGERRDALDQRWAALLGAAGLTPVPVPNLIADPATFLDATGIELLVLTGGNDLAYLDGATATAPERDATERALLDAAAARALPVLGVCRGLQLMVEQSGGHVRAVSGHVASPHPIEVRNRSRWPIGTDRVVNSFHGWGIEPDDVGGLEPLAFAPDGTVEAAAHPDLPQVGIMWHPERPPATADDRALLDALLGWEA